VALEEGVIIFENYFADCATDLSCLVSWPTEDGGLYHIVADASFTLEDGTQIVYDKPCPLGLEYVERLW
jgi:hypothetical protein